MKLSTMQRGVCDNAMIALRQLLIFADLLNVNIQFDYLTESGEHLLRLTQGNSVATVSVLTAEEIIEAIEGLQRYQKG